MPSISKSRKAPMQFSKKIVIGVTLAVSILCYFSIGLMYAIGEVQYMADVIKMYITYAMVVFASYSGNSIAEKIILHGHNPLNKEDPIGGTSKEDTN